MAGRPTKQGLEYFPFDVDFFNDEKVEFVSARFGVKGEIITVRLMCKIYRIGYFTEWNEDESTLLAKRAGDNISPALVSDVVNELVKRRFFDESLLDRFGILTSKGIQRRYVRATSDRKEVEINRDYWLVDWPKNATAINLPPINSISPPINPINPPSNAQSKVKESKGEGSKESVRAGDAAPLAPKVNKEKFADYVSMTVEEHEKLTAEFGEADTVRMVEILNNYKGSTGKKYKSDYLAIRNWVVGRLNEEKRKTQQNGKSTLHSRKLDSDFD